MSHDPLPAETCAGDREPAHDGRGRELRHIAVIMDGNGRWASRRRMPRAAGHVAGARTARTIISAAREHGLEYLTLYVFSSENWQRPSEEVAGLMNLARRYFPAYLWLVERGIRLVVIGNREDIPEDLRRMITISEQETAGCRDMTLILAFNYGGRWDITAAAQRLARACVEEGRRWQELDEADFGALLATGDAPPPDLLIRTGGEQRLSNFLLWQTAYSEIIFTGTLWPDFGAQDLRAAIDTFHGRERRFGHAEPVGRNRDHRDGDALAALPSGATVTDGNGIVAREGGQRPGAVAGGDSFRIRFPTAIGLALLALLAVRAGYPFFPAILLATAVLASVEWDRLLFPRWRWPLLRGALAGGAILATALVQARQQEGWGLSPDQAEAGLSWPVFLPLLLPLAGSCLSFLAPPDRRALAVAGPCLVMAVVFPLALLEAGDTPGTIAILWLFACIWGSDTGGYLAGRFFGGRRLAPAISPGKTWAGLAGALVAGTLCGGLVIRDMLAFPLVASFLLSASGQAGDLSLSWVKRTLGIKDFGTILPGHGGIWDRLDSFWLSAPLALVLFSADPGAPS